MSTPIPAVAAALTAQTRRWAFRYQALNNNNVPLRNLDVVSCSVSNNALADNVKRTCRIRIASTSVFDQLSERCRVWADLTLADSSVWSFPMGTFLLSTNGKRVAAVAGDRTSDYEGYDLLEVLVEDRVTSRYVVASGTAYTTAVGTVLGTAGFSASMIAASTATLPAAMEWEVGTSKLTIINDLLTAINYETLTMTPLGEPTSQPYLEPDDATAIWAYAVSPLSVIVPGIDNTLDVFDVPNTWVGLVSQPDRAPLVSTKINSDPGSPTSTVNRGRSIVKILEGTEDAYDQATLDALVARYAAQTSLMYEEVSFSTVLMPFHESGDVFTLDDGSGTGPRSFREHSWDLDLQSGGTMKHVMRRTVSL